MLKLLTAEWRKMAGNRPVMMFMIWIFPIGALILNAFMLVLLLATPSAARRSLGQVRWDEQMAFAWILPGSDVGRLLVIGFAAFVIAGEYQWGTWKSILPRNRRLPIILSKFLTIALMITLSITLTAIIQGIGGALIAAVLQQRYEPEVTGTTVGNFLRLYGVQMVLGLVTTTIGAGYAALAAIFSRSILGGLVVGFSLMALEPIFLVALSIFGNWIDRPEIIVLYQYLPTYNINNASSWILNDRPLNLPVLSQFAGPNSLALSLFILAAWVIGLISLSAYLFHQQDITV